MVNRRTAAILLSLMLVVLVPTFFGFRHTSLFAQAVPTYLYGAQMTNLNEENATVTFSLLDTNGDIIGDTVADVIPANASKTYFPLSDLVTADCGEGAWGQSSLGSTSSSRFIFSRGNCVLVAASDERLATIVNIVSADLSAGESYWYRDAGSEILYLPLLNQGNSGYNTWFSVQNANEETANVRVDYTDGTFAEITIPPNQSHTFSQAQETHTQRVFAGIITSDQPLSSYVVQEDAQVIFAYTAFTTGSTNPVFPLINANNAGYVTGLQLQNIGADTTTVQIAYTPAGIGTPCTETQSIEANESRTFVLSAFATGTNSNCVPNQSFVGSARVVSNSTNQPLIGITNQLLPGLNGAAYGGFDPQQVTEQVIMPLIMDRNSGFFTGFIVQNVGTETTTVECTFTNSNYQIAQTLEPGQSFSDIQQNKIAPNYVGSGTCTAEQATARIVAVVNELGSDALADQLFAYEGISPLEN